MTDLSHQQDDYSDKPLLNNRYRLIRKLGRGGMGEVYLAQQIELNRRVAIKILIAERSKKAIQEQRFEQEAKAIGQISHPNIVDIFDVGRTEDDRSFFVMEYLLGEDLKRFCRRKHVVPTKEIISIATQICHGLSAAHEKNIIHRDLKPDNIFLIKTAEAKDVIKILDFGLAKVISDDEAEVKKLTKTGVIVGTPAYLSPEQVRGDPIDARTDIYALGLIIYRMLCGHMPFKANTVVEMLRKQMMETPLKPSEVAPDSPIDLGLEAIAMQALQKDPTMRFNSAKDVIDALTQVQNGIGYDFDPEKRKEEIATQSTQHKEDSTTRIQHSDYEEKNLEISLIQQKPKLQLIIIFVLLIILFGLGLYWIAFR